MTVAGQKNHYNVKLLKGYGVSINLLDIVDGKGQVGQTYRLSQTEYDRGLTERYCDYVVSV